MRFLLCNKSSEENSVNKWPLSSEQRWIPWIRFLRTLFYIIFRTVERIFDLREICTSRVNPYHTRSSWNGHLVQGFERKDCLKNELLEWNQRPDFPGAGTSYNYPSRRERNQKLVICSMLEAFGLHLARMVLDDPDPQHTARECSKAIPKLLSRAKASVRFREVFTEVIKYLEILNRSSNATLLIFLKTRANIIIERKNIVLLDFLHTHCCYLTVPANRYEWAFACHSLFMAEEAGFESYYGKIAWQKQIRTFRAALSLVGFAAFDKCSPSPNSKLIETEFKGVEKILLIRPNFDFKRFYSAIGHYHDESYRDLMMYDISFNCCNEVAESRWSVQTLERAVWTLEHGRKHIGMELYNELKGFQGKRKLDLSHMNAVQLMTFSMSGMVRFCGRDEGVYRLTGCHEAKVEVHGNLPLPTIQDLLTLHILKPLRMKRYKVSPLPGVSKSFKAVRIGTRIKLVESHHAEAFSAEPWQQVQ